MKIGRLKECKRHYLENWKLQMRIKSFKVSTSTKNMDGDIKIFILSISVQKIKCVLVSCISFNSLVYCGIYFRSCDPEGT